MFILGIIFIVLLYFVFQKNILQTKKQDEDSQAKELLKKRFVLGEIDTETYLKMKELL